MAEMAVIFFILLCSQELDQMEPGDKFPEHFRVTLDVAVSAKERPQPGASFPWQGFTGKGIGPRILFTTKEEQEEILNQYGNF